MNKDWTAQEKQILRYFYPLHGAPIVGKLTRRPLTAIRKQAQGLGVRRVGGAAGQKKRAEVAEWEQRNGPVPEGFVLFLYPSSAPRTWENLRLAPASEAWHLRGNQAQKVIPPEVRSLNGIKSQLSRQLNRIERANGVESSRARRRMWAPEEVAFLTANQATWTARQMAAHLGRTVRAVKHAIKRRDLQGKPNVPWTASDDECLRMLHQTTEFTEIAQRLGRTRKSVERRAHRLHLNKRRPQCNRP